MEMKLPYTVKEISPLNNSGFSRVEVSVMYEGLNRNGSVFTAEAVQSLIESLPGAPIVGFYDGEDFTDHEKFGSFEEETEEFLIHTRTKPYGFVTQEKPQMKNIDGKDYIVAEGMLWTKRFPEALKVLEERNNQSMEIEPSTMQFYNMVDGTPIVVHAEIAALCILGQEVEPAFEEAKFVREGFLEFMLKAQGASLEEEEDESVELKEEMLTETPEDVKVEGEEAIENTEVETEATEASEPVVDFEDVAAETEETPSEDTVEVEVEVETEVEVEEDSELEAEVEVEADEKEDALLAELEALRVFKADVERKEKMSVLNREIYSNVPTEFKQELANEIDSYSLVELEGRLAIKALEAGFSASVKEETPIVTPVVSNTTSEPAWVSAVRNYSKK